MKALLTVLLFACSLTVQATPMAWGQPMPENCTTTFEWKSPDTYPVRVYKDPTCVKPWAANAVTFWQGIANWLRER